MGAQGHPASEFESFGDVQGVLPHIDHPAGEPIRVLEGALATLTIGVRAGDRWAMVGPGGGQLVVDGPVTDPRPVDPLTIAFVPQSGAEGQLRFVGPDFDLPVATWRAVPAHDLAELRVAGIWSSTVLHCSD